jgi:phenylacetate-CoA ligase
MKRALSRKRLWEDLPPWLRGGLGKALSIVPPAALLGTRFRRSLRFAQEAERWPVERAREYQLTRLREICSLAYEKTSFYRRQFDSVGFEPGDLKSLDDVSRLPRIDKTTVIENLDAMCAVPPESSVVDYVSTGGTSGEPLHFYIGADRSATEYGYLVALW